MHTAWHYTRVSQSPAHADAAAIDEHEDHVDMDTAAARVEQKHMSRVLSAMILVLPVCLALAAVPRTLWLESLSWLQIAIVDAACLVIFGTVFVGFQCLRPDAFSTLWLVLPLGIPPLFTLYAVLWMTTDAIGTLMEERRASAGLEAITQIIFGGIHSTLQPRALRWKVGVLAAYWAFGLFSALLLSYAHSLDAASLVLFNTVNQLIPSAAGFVLVQLLLRSGGEILEARLRAVRVQLAESERRNCEFEDARRQAVASRALSYYRSEYGERQFEPSETSSDSSSLGYNEQLPGDRAGHRAGSVTSHQTTKLGDHDHVYVPSASGHTV